MKPFRVQDLSESDRRKVGKAVFKIMALSAFYGSCATFAILWFTGHIK